MGLRSIGAACAVVVMLALPDDNAIVASTAYPVFWIVLGNMILFLFVETSYSFLVVTSNRLSAEGMLCIISHDLCKKSMFLK